MDKTSKALIDNGSQEAAGEANPRPAKLEYPRCANFRRMTRSPGNSQRDAIVRPPRSGGPEGG